MLSWSKNNVTALLYTVIKPQMVKGLRKLLGGGGGGLVSTTEYMRLNCCNKSDLF